MRALQYAAFGPAKDVLSQAEIDTPAPAEGQVRIKTILSPIHNHDLWTIAGTYGYKPALPAIGGSEAVGTIEAVGPGVDDALIGKRVAASGTGTWAEHFIASAAGVLPVPDTIGDAAAAQLMAMPFSAIALLDFLNVGAGDWVVQSAANGAVGKIFAKLADARGIKVLNLVRRSEAKAALEALGMENVIATDGTDWREAAREIVGKDGARAAVDSVGGALAGDLANLVGYKGELVIFGSATGEPMTIESGPVIFNQLTIRGFWGAKILPEMEGEKRKRLITELVTLAAKGELPLDVDGEYGLDQGREAMVAALTPGRKGKVLIRP